MISAHLRRTIRTLYGFACGYYGVTETEVGAYLTIDHFKPQQAGGTDDIENLVYACHTCNMFKSAAWNPDEPSVLHPLQVDLRQHILTLPDGLLQGLTAEGERHLTTLHLNRTPAVERRKIRQMLQELAIYERLRLEREKHLKKEADTKTRRIRRKRRFSN